MILQVEIRITAAVRITVVVIMIGHQGNIIVVVVFHQRILSIEGLQLAIVAVSYVVVVAGDLAGTLMMIVIILLDVLVVIIMVVVPQNID